MSRLPGELIAIGGGNMADCTAALERLVKHTKSKRDGRLVVVTVATSDDRGASGKYNSLFRRHGVKHVDTVAILERENALSPASVQKIEDADAVFFTGGDQLNITSLFGGSPLHDALTERHEAGLMIAGTSAGAAMMSSSMIISGDSDSPATVGGVEIAPGMDLVHSSIIDSHFSQRGRHGRLLTAVAHFPQVLGIGIDERTAAVFKNGVFEVIGPGSVTVIDGSKMEHSDITYREEGDSISMFGVKLHVLPEGYQFDLAERKPINPRRSKAETA